MIFQFKSYIKDAAMKRLYSVPARTLAIANVISEKGIPNTINYNYNSVKSETLSFVESLNVEPYAYKYAKSCNEPTIYSSVYACMLYGLYGEIDKLNANQKKGWADYFNRFQCDDGYFRDPVLLGDEFEGDCGWGDGWGIRHLAGHLIIAFARLGYNPRYPFHFLEKYYDVSDIEKWLAELFATKDMWTASNYIMNIVTLLQYSRDYMHDSKAQHTINFILKWLRARQNPQTGLWHNDPISTERDLHTAIRGAYHYYPLFIYENQKIDYQESIIDHILKSQNSWGGFEMELTPSGACEDIDALDPLIRFSINKDHRKTEVDLTIQRALYWMMSNKNKDGGFLFMPETPHEYGSHPQTSSKANESNLFATWFRTLCLAYMVKYLNIENDFNVKKYPGYEISFM